MTEVLVEEDKPQRRLRNYLLQPLIQVKLALYSMILSVLFAVLTLVIFILSFRHLFGFVIDLTEAREYIVTEVQAQFMSVLQLQIVFLLFYLALLFSVTILYTHKLIGPSIAFRRHINRLTKGDYTSRIHLRSGDAFVEVADELNELAKTLQRQQRGS